LLLKMVQSQNTEGFQDLDIALIDPLIIFPKWQLIFPFTSSLKFLFFLPP